MKPIPKLYLVFIHLCIGISIYFSYTDTPILFGIFKGLTTSLILLIPLLYGISTNSKYKRLIVMGLCFCLGGDILLLEESYFVFGLVSFLIGHLFFLLGFLNIQRQHKSFSILLTLVIIAGLYYGYLFSELESLAIPVLVYIIFIVLMAWRGISLYDFQKDIRYIPIAVGVILFMLSDGLIAFNKFILDFNLSNLFILSTYWCAIFLIAQSTCIDFTSDQEKLKSSKL